MEQLKVDGFDLNQICRICLTCDVSKTDIFLFSSDLGKTIADIIMECAPVQIMRHDKMPTFICEICFTQLKKFHQFQMQAVRSDRKLQRYLQHFNNCHPQIKVEMAFEELSDNMVNQNCNADINAKCEPVENSDEFNIFYPKQKMITNFIAVNKFSEEISLESEIKDEPLDDNNSPNPAECVETVETLSVDDGNEISCEDSMIEFVDTKLGVDAPGNFQYENGITDRTAMELEETYIPLKEADSSSLCPENIKNCNCHLTGEKPYRCEICQMCFGHSNTLKSHKLKHTGEKPFECDVCKMCFRRYSHLREHTLKHTGEKPYQCDVCKMCFRYSNSLKSHNLKHTGEKRYQCDICKKCFSESSNLRKHNLIHTGEKPFECDVCKMSFRYSYSLKSHKLKHTGEKPHTCDICKMSFRTPSHLKNHNLIHTGEKPYKCDICQMCFKQVGHLQTHKLMHTGEKPYQCDICEMCFRQAVQLKSHKLKHTGEKPFQCDICKVCFRHPYSVKRHKLIHTGQKPYQ